MSSRLQWAAIAAAAAIGLGGGIYFGLSQNRPDPGRQAINSLYATSLPDQEQHLQGLSQWKDRILLVNFWATWCVPCREEIPELVRIQSRYSSKNVQIVGIAIDSPEQVKPFAKYLSINYPVLIGGLESIDLARSLGNRSGALPFTVVLAPGGTAVRTHLGALTAPEIEGLVAEMQAAKAP